MDFRALLDSVTSALTMVQTIGATPGVNLIPYVSTIVSAAGVLKFGIEAGKNVADDIAAFKAAFDHQPTPEELAALDARIAALRTELHAPMPAKDADEPE
jgi:hypothetical protein